MFLFSIFLRSIRRRLVTGFGVAFTFFAVMVAFAVWALVQHQQAVAQLEYLLDRSPDRGKLESAITNILRPFHDIDIQQDAAVNMLRYQIRNRIESAIKEQEHFHRKSLNAQTDPQFLVLGLGQRTPLLSVTMGAVQRELDMLRSHTDTLDFRSIVDPQGREYVKSEVEKKMALSISKMHRLLSRLPAQEEETNVLTSLRAEQTASARVLKNVGFVIVGAIVAYGITIFLGFQWISNPLRAAAQGASRIANGDTDYRLERFTRWDDEFFDLTENFNRMADRFQESEDQLNEKVEERSRQLVRSERLAGVGFLAAGVAHEINNPLQAMSMAAESIQLRLLDHLEHDDEETQEIMDRLNMIQLESKRCGQITRRLLDFARNERQDKERDDLTRVIGEVLAMVQPMSRYSDRKIIFERTAPLLLEINASEMKQVVLNLVSNALHATESGGIIEIKLEEQTDWVVLLVRDNGQGMSPENIENLFEPFYTTKETGIGTGLGLSITHRIVVDHNGTIDPQSEGPGKGSTFLIRLPRRQPAQKAA